MLSDLDAITSALLDTKYSSIISCFCIPCRIACVASVSNRVIVRKLERGSFIFFFLALVPTISTNSRGNACYARYVPNLMITGLYVYVQKRDKSTNSDVEPESNSISV